MDKEIKIEARNQFLKYFKIWFIAVGVLAVITIIMLIANARSTDSVRNNTQAPAERVYDMADVLTDSEEDALRELVAEVEEKIKADIVLVTSNLVMEGAGAPSNGSWETNMMNTADDFYDQNQYGYNMPCGDGVLILDNWYEGQAGSWLSTCGSMIEEFSMYDTNQVLDVIYYGIDYSAYSAYRDAIEEIGNIAGKAKIDGGTYGLGAFVISTAAALIFIFMKLRGKEGEKTVVAGTYVDSLPITNVHRDQFIRKIVTKRHIPRQNTNGGSGGHSSGGSHRSSGGVRHGGGGRRR